jgi:hypothetical protein
VKFRPAHANALNLFNTGAPAGGTDLCHIYSADQAAGNACPHIRTENGSTIKLFKGAALTAADASTVDSTYGAEEAAVIANLRTRLNELEARLQAAGFIT